MSRTRLNIAGLTSTVDLSGKTISNFATTGNVGIGTESPSAKLHVVGKARFNTATGTDPVTITKIDNDAESLKIWIDDVAVLFQSTQDEAGSYGYFKFNQKRNDTEENRNTFEIDGDNQKIFHGGQIQHRFDNGGNWQSLGSFNTSSDPYLHVKTSLHYTSDRRSMLRATGFYPDSKYGHGYIGCYTNPATPDSPYGQLTANLGNYAVANNQYYSTDGYWVIVLLWSSAYNTPWLEYISAGGSYGNITNVSILGYTWTAANTGAY